MIFQCCNLVRKALVLQQSTLNGIDYLEVLDHEAIPLNSPRQRTLLLHCLKTAPTGLAPSNILITGGESITGITVRWLSPASAPPPLATTAENAYFSSLPDKGNVLVIRTNVAGDFSPYLLRLVNNAMQAAEDPFHVTEALSGFDPELAEIQFSFKVECGPNFDCGPVAPYCPPNAPTPPPINYLAKDYGSFRTIILDRLNQLLPSWGATSEADFGIVLAEVIAYVSDYLSYQQDAVATEAYLQTARSRISLRRHARLVDYFVHDGCNARAWIQINVVTRTYLDKRLTRFSTIAPGTPLNLDSTPNKQAALAVGAVVFEPMQDAVLDPSFNTMSFYTWGDTDCCLPQGATEATLLTTLGLKVGDVLIFQEVLGPETGNSADADIRHRCAVRLAQVAIQDGQGNPLVDPLFGNTPITEIQWAAADALPFPLCVSSTVNGVVLPNVTLVYGNVILADQGLFFCDIKLPAVPQPTLRIPPNPAADRCNAKPRSWLPVRYRPQLPSGPVTQAVPMALAGVPVTNGLVFLTSTTWTSLKDSAGSVSLMAQAADPQQWPQYFGIIVKANAAHSQFIDLSVVYTPPGGAFGIASGKVLLETFTALSLSSGDANYAPTIINAASLFITVPTAGQPSGVTPSGFPTNPTMLLVSGSLDLQDTSPTPVTYLIVQPTNPLAWPPWFGMQSQSIANAPDQFNFSIVYDPPSGGVGVQLPIVIEQFNAVDLSQINAFVSAHSPLINIQIFEDEPQPNLSAADLMTFDPADAIPSMTLHSSYEGSTAKWTPQPDLLEDGPDDPYFVVEVEYDNSAHLRFGDGINGKIPDSGTTFTADYRIGNGTAGNVGADTITVVFGNSSGIQSCTNPLPAIGGFDPETNAQIRRRAPQAFMTQERAVTMPDYVAAAEQGNLLDNAVATLRWTGSWYTVFITAEPVGAGNLTPTLSKVLANNVNKYRLAGQDIQLESPQYVPLQIALSICVDPSYFNAAVKTALSAVLGSQLLPDGTRGYFYPDNFTFGQTVYLSPIYAGVRSVPGVCTVTATVFAPQGDPSKVYLMNGEIPLGPFQIARMDNDPSFPNHGQLTLNMEGGK